MSKEIYLIDKNIPFVKEILGNYGEAYHFTGKELDNKTLLQTRCTSLFTRSTVKVNEELLSGTNVKFVATATSGTDHVDKNYLKKKNIYFASALGSNANSVAEYVVWNILNWSMANHVEIKNKTIGIIGYGNVGKLVANYANKLGLNILINDPPLFKNGYKFDFEHKELIDLIKRSAIVTNHVPLTNSGKHSTKMLLDDNELSHLKENSLFFHTSRGGVVNEETLSKSIKEKNISSVVDVWIGEPDFNTDLASIADFATPHIAGHAYDSKLKGSKMVLDAYSKFSGMDIDRSIIEKEIAKGKQDIIIDYNNLTLLKNEIEKSRNLNIDYQRFMEISKLDKEIRIKEFYDYRKNYPIKREHLSI